MPRPLVFALVGCALFVWLYGAIDPVAFADSGMMYYRPMAEAAPGLDLSQPQPYVFRWLGPWLAGLLPLPEGDAFYLLAVLGSFALAALTYGVLRADGRSAEAAGLTALLLTMNPYLFGFNVFNHYQLDDLLAQLGLGAALGLLWRGRYGWMGAALALTVLAREPAVLMVPVAAVFLWERGRLRADGPRVALALVPVALLFVVPRALADNVGGLGLAEALAHEVPKMLLPSTWARLLVNAWVPVVVVLAAWPREALAWVRSHLHLVVLLALTAASAFFGTDQERLMQPAIWAVYPAVAFVLDRRWRGAPVAVAVLLGAGVLASLHHITARFPLPSRELTAALAGVSLALAAAAAMWVRLGRTSRAGRPRSSPS